MQQNTFNTLSRAQFSLGRFAWHFEIGLDVAFGPLKVPAQILAARVWVSPVCENRRALARSQEWSELWNMRFSRCFACSLGELSPGAQPSGV